MDCHGLIVRLFLLGPAPDDWLIISWIERLTGSSASVNFARGPRLNTEEIISDRYEWLGTELCLPQVDYSTLTAEGPVQCDVGSASLAGCG